MSFFTSGLFWFLEGILACLMLVGLKIWAEDHRIPMPMWKWLLFCIWILMIGFTIAFVGTCLGENELTAAIKGGITFGAISVVTGAGLWRLLLKGKESSET